MQGLLRELLQLVGDRAAARRAVLGVYGEVLSQRNMQEDSALAFTAAQDLPRALQAYKVAGHWQMALTLAGHSLHLQDACSLLSCAKCPKKGLLALSLMTCSHQLATNHSCPSLELVIGINHASMLPQHANSSAAGVVRLLDDVFCDYSSDGVQGG